MQFQLSAESSPIFVAQLGEVCQPGAVITINPDAAESWSAEFGALRDGRLREFRGRPVEAPAPKPKRDRKGPRKIPAGVPMEIPPQSEG